MDFSSLEFLFLFLPLSLILYRIVPRSLPLFRNAVLLAVSLVFYGWNEPRYVFLLIGVAVIDYVFGLLIGKMLDTDPGKARLAVIGAVVINAAILIVFKLFGEAIGGVPVGISFYILAALGYVIDVFRRDTASVKDPVAFGAGFAMFPKIIAGPIMRGSETSRMLAEHDGSLSLFASGIRTFLCGLGKTMLLANAVGQFWAAQSALEVSQRTVMGAWIGLICFAFKIYYEFSGYCDMAIGLGKMLGFKLPENFNYPYMASSMTDFWQRWHITLVAWFRDYVFMPLSKGGSSGIRLYINLAVTWVMVGFWHGSGLTLSYAVWGLYLFAVMALEQAVLSRVLARIPAVFGHIYALVVVLIGWTLFAFGDLGSGAGYLGNLFGVGGAGATAQIDFYNLSRLLPVILVCIVAATPYPRRLFYALYEKTFIVRAAAYAAGAAVLALSVSYMVDSAGSYVFQYFRF